MNSPFTRHEIRAASDGGTSTAHVTLTTSDPTSDVAMRLLLERAGLYVTSHVATPVGPAATR